MDRSILNDKDRLAALYAKHTTGEIGEMIGLHSEYVRKALHALGIPVRSKGARTESDIIERATIRFHLQLGKFKRHQRLQILSNLVEKNQYKKIKI